MAKGKKDKAKSPGSIQIKNKKAYRDYELIEKIEAGMALKGTEVKSLRNAHADLDGSYAKLVRNECYLVGANISPYENAGYAANHEIGRDRKLLLHKRQILKIRHRLEQKGFTIIPLRIYFNDRGLAKIELAVARGKKKYDKREKLTKREHTKEIKF